SSGASVWGMQENSFAGKASGAAGCTATCACLRPSGVKVRPKRRSPAGYPPAGPENWPGRQYTKRTGRPQGNAALERRANSGETANADRAIWKLQTFRGQGVLFGIVISISFCRRCRAITPREGCRMLAGELRNHVLVVEDTHLGTRASWSI